MARPRQPICPSCKIRPKALGQGYCMECRKEKLAQKLPRGPVVERPMADGVGGSIPPAAQGAQGTVPTVVQPTSDPKQKKPEPKKPDTKPWRTLEPKKGKPDDEKCGMWCMKLHEHRR